MKKSEIVARAARRSANILRVQKWRKINPGRWKVSANDPQEERRRAERAAFVAGHWHTCITKSCGSRYHCKNACDAKGEGLANSICESCLAKEMVP